MTNGEVVELNSFVFLLNRSEKNELDLVIGRKITGLIERKSKLDPSKKKFRIPGEKIKPLIPAMGGAMASDRILVDGMKVGFMYRVEPTYPQDSGWNFFAGDESQDYADNPDNLGIYDVNTICNYDPAIIPYLDYPAGSALGRVEGEDRFELEEMPEDPDEK